MIYLIFIENLLMTSFVEGAAIYLLYKKRDFVYYSLLCNLLTNPAMNLFLLIGVKTLGSSYYWLCLAILEIIAMLAEAYIYQMLGGLKISRALLLSAFLNSSSFLFGFMIWHFYS